MEQSPNGHPKSWLMAALVFGLLVVCYWPALRGELVWNDRDYVTRPELRSLAGLGRIWTEPGATEQYYPLLHSAFWLQGRLWGEQPLGCHLVTLALHGIAAVMFALFLRRLWDHNASPSTGLRAFDSGGMAEGHERRRYAGAEWLAALLFAVHPVHVQSVAWITEQKNTLSLVFYLGAALAWLRFDTTRGRGAWLAAFGLFALSLFCKTVTATLPAALLVLVWWRRGRVELRRDAMPLLPWLALSVVAGLFASWVEQHYLGARGEDFDLPLVQRGLVAGRAVWFYLGHIVWPVQLNFIYPRWTPDPAVWWQWLYPLGIIALAGGLWAWRRRSRAPLAAFLIFAGSLFPVLGFVNLYGGLYSWVWDHWQYLPDLAPLALLAAGLARGWESLGPRGRGAGPILAGVLVVALAALSWRHASIFRDDETLYRATLARNPASWMAHNNLANLLVTQPGREYEAVTHYRLALPDNPQRADVCFNLAQLLARLPSGEAGTEAVARYEESLRLKPGNALAHYNLGKLLARQPHRIMDALAYFERAVQLAPDLAEAHNDLAALLATQPGRGAEVIAHYEAALRINPALLDARFNLASHLARQPGREPEVIGHIEQVLRANPRDADAHYILATALAGLRRQAEAIAHCEQALQIRPDYPAARQLLDYLRARQ